LSSYRHDVSNLIPKATRIAWHLKKDEIKDDIPNATKRKFLFNLSRSNYEREWGKDYRKPSPYERFLAFLYKLVPKFGPLTILHFFAEPDAPYATKRNAKAWARVQTQLQQLRSAMVTCHPANSAQRAVPEGPTTP